MLPTGISVEQSGVCVTAHVTDGELTAPAMQELVDDCAERMRYSNARHFIFDLSGVEYLASACLGVLVTFMQEVEHFRGRIAVAGCRDNVKFLFNVTNLDRVFGLYDDVEQAQAAL
jgi:anti-anti-sigma factor